MKQFYKIFFSLLLFLSFFSSKLYSQIEIGIKEGSGNQVIVYMTSTTPINYSYAEFTVCVRWPVNIITNPTFNSSYSINPISSNISSGFTYQSFSTPSLGAISFLAGQELDLFTLDYTYLPSGDCAGSFEIIDDVNAASLGGKLELMDGTNPTVSWNPTIGNASAANLNPVKISGTVKDDILCKNQNTGSILVAATTEYSTLEYTVGGVTQSSSTFTGLTAGTYSIAASNGNCTATAPSVVISEPSSAVSISSQIATDITCNNANDGSIVIIAAGGTGSLQYSIDDGNIYDPVSTFENLAEGSYIIKVKDANNCIVTGATRMINNPAAITIQGEVKEDILCNGVNNGSLTITAVGGSGTISYSKDGGANYLNNGGEFSNLPAGLYSIKVKDSKNCELVGSNFEIEEPDLLSIDDVLITPTSTCSAVDGELNVTASGGTGTLSYSIGGITYQSANSFGPLPRGNYKVFVKDENECSVNENVTITDANPVIIDSLSVSSLECYGDLDGEIIVHARGGIQPLSYSLDNTNYYSSNIFSNLMGSNYAIFVKDAQGCYVYESAQIIQPAAIEVSVVSVDNINTCFGDSIGEVRFSAIGGTGSLLYSIDGENFQYSSIFADIPGGTYTCTVKDANLCEATIPAIIIQPDELVSNLTVTDITCYDRNNGAIRIAPSGGTPSYTIEWSVIDGDSDDYNLSSLVPGFYWYKITDTHNCELIDTVEITRPEEMTMSANIENLSCYGAKDGSIEAIISGGQSPYKYRWSNNQMSAKITSLEAEEYRLEVTDFRQCKEYFFATVTQPNALSLRYDLYNASYYGSDDGRIVVDVNGGTKPYYYDWIGETSSNSQLPDNWSIMSITDSVYSLPTGDYQLIVSDANFCEISFPDPLKVSVNQTDIVIPTAFTPNGDGKNDTWIIPNIVKQEYTPKLKIFDSRGYLVYEKDDSFDGWGWEGTDNSGNPLPGSTLYYYVIEVNKNIAPFKGTVYIIR